MNEKLTVIALVVVIVAVVLITYYRFEWIMGSGLPDWLKYLLLSR